MPAYASSNSSSARFANDADYDSEWRSTGVPAWLAYDLSSVSAAHRQHVLAVYYNNSYGYTTEHGPHYNNWSSYTFESNKAPGGREPPATGWTTLSTVANNTFHSRQHELTLDGANWLRVRITASDGSPLNTDAAASSFDVYDLDDPSTVRNNLVFFGDSITASGLCPCGGEQVPGVAELVAESRPGQWPIIENGGEPYQTSQDAVAKLLGPTGWLARFPGQFVGVSYGMNDAATASGADTFYANMKRIVLAVTEQGKTPVIPLIGYTDEPAHQANIPAFNERIQRLYGEFPDIVRGPDFWTFFRDHPGLVQAGDIHPTEAGYAAMRQQWAATLTAGGFGSATASPGAPTDTPTGTATPSPTGTHQPAGLHVVGNSIRNGAGEIVRLVGVNHSGTEYACVGGEDGTGEKAIFEPADFGTNPEYLRVIKSWGANAVRIGLNEHCWLGVNGVEPAFSGDRYRQAVEQFVRIATSNGLAVILELHWSAPGGFLAHGQAPMPDRDHSVAMWRQVAAAFKTNGSVVFDVFNEPYPYLNEGGDGAWRCWRDGSQVADPGNATQCAGTQWWDQDGNEFNHGSGWHYQVAGMQELVDAIRDEGATNLVLLSGVQYANNLREWLTYKPADPVNNLAASWHSYNFNACAPSSCWDAEITPVAAAVPLVVSEFGQHGCAADYVNPLLGWLDARHASYLAWTWNTWGCAGMALLEDYASGTPTPFGRYIRDHFLAVRPEAGRPG